MSVGTGSASPSVLLAVSGESVCITGFKPVALSGFSVTIADPSAPATSGTAVPLDPSQAAELVFTPRQDLNAEGAQATVHTFVSYSDGTVADISSSVRVQGHVFSVPSTYSLSVNSTLPVVTVNASYGDAALCGAGLNATWVLCSAVPMGSSLGTLNIAMPSPLAIAEVWVEPFVSSATDGAAQSLVAVPTSSPIRIFLSFSDGTLRDFSSDPRTSLSLTSGVGLCSIVPSQAGSPQLTVLRPGTSGTCSVQAVVSFPRFPSLRLANSTLVTAVSAVNLYLRPVDVATPPPLSTQAAGLPAEPAATVRLLRCDWRGYEARSVWALAQLSNCTQQLQVSPGGTGCTLYDINSPTAGVQLSIGDAAVVSLVSNPAATAVPLHNLLLPVAPGQTVLHASFGAGSPALTTLRISVEDTFLPAWPRVQALADTTFDLAAQMVASGFTLSYMVLPSTEWEQRLALGSAPTAQQVEDQGMTVEETGPVNPPADGADPAGPFIYQATVSGLAPATNYTALLVVRSGDVLVQTLLVLSGVLTPDNVAPSFTTLGPLAPIQLQPAAQTFNLSLPLSVDKPCGIGYALFRAKPCAMGRPNAAQVAAGAPPSLARCTCSNQADCAPVAFGVLDASGPGRNVTLRLQVSAAWVPLQHDTDSIVTRCWSTPTMCGSRLCNCCRACRATIRSQASVVHQARAYCAPQVSGIASTNSQTCVTKPLQHAQCVSASPQLTSRSLQHSNTHCSWPHKTDCQITRAGRWTAGEPGSIAV